MPSIPIIGQFEAPTMVFACKYFYLNATINNPDGKAYFVNCTVEISNSIILKWENSTDTFSEYQDTNNYCTLDTANSFKTTVNSTAYKLSWKIRLGWNYPEGSVDVIATNTKVFDVFGASGSNSYTGLFHFEDDLIVASASVDDSRINPSQNIAFSGHVYYESTTIPPAEGNSALSFDGVDDYVEIADASSLRNFTQGLTYCAWINTSDFTLHEGSVRRILDKNARLSFGVYPKQRLFFRLRINDTNYDHVSDSLIPSGEWVFVAVTYDGSNVIFYIDGVPDTPQPRIGVIDEVTGNQFIGCYFTKTSGCFNGIIDEVRIYNRVLSATEISEHYQGIYRNETGLALYLNFDGDTLDRSGQWNHGTNYGATWTNGYANINVKIELQGLLKGTVAVVNSTSGTFTIPVMAESNPGQYYYTVYATTPAGNTRQNQTLSIIVDRVKIIEGGTTQSSVCIGETQIIWFKAIYEFDNSEFNESCGRLYLNGSAMKWSATNKRWEYEYTPDTLGPKTFQITSVLDTKHGLTCINDVAGVQTITVHTRWYEPIVWLINSPYFWVTISIIILILLFRFKVIEVEIEKSPKSY